MNESPCVSKPWLQNYDSQVPAHLTYPTHALHDFLRISAQRFPDHLCTIFQDQVLTYCQVDRLSDALAAILLKLGLQKGDRVGLLLPNSPQFVIAFYAVLKAGGIAVALNPLYKQRELQFHLDDAGVSFLMAVDELIPTLDGFQTRQKINHRFFTNLTEAAMLSDIAELKPGESIHPSTTDDWRLLDAMKTGMGMTFSPGPVGQHDPAVLQYTGGTTGIPKGAVGLHRNLIANTLQFKAWLHGLDEGREVVLAAIPLFHVYGMVIAMSLGIASAGCLVLIPNARDIDDLLCKIERYHATLFPGVPNLYNAINRHPDVQSGKFNLRSIKACISGSAPLMLETKQTFEKLTGGKLMEGYGLSEAPTATHCNPLSSPNRNGSIGLPLPDVECRIVDLETGKIDMPPGEIGELILRSPQVMQGYYHNSAETRLALRDGWLFTGDVAKMDEAGFFYLVDRKKEEIKIGGFQVWPREVEEVIAAHHAVLECAVAGVPDKLDGERVKAWVVLKPGVTLDSKEIIQWCKDQLVAYKAPIEVEWIEALPRTTVGKVLRRELVQRHLDKKNKKN